MTDTRFSITKLNNANFQVWKCKVELLLIREDLWHTVSGNRPLELDERWLKADRQARATIGLLVEDDQLRHIKNITSAKEAWLALQNYHQKASLTNQVFLFKRICSMKLTENGDMESHLNTMLNTIDQLAALGETLKDINFEDQQVRRSERCNKGIPPERYCNLVRKEETIEPSTYEEAIRSSNSTQWTKGMKEEYDLLISTNAWTLVKRPINTNVVGCKWVYKAKTDAQGRVIRYKARLVAQGFTQYGTDYTDVFAPVARQATFRTLLAIAGKQNLSIRHYDVKKCIPK